VKYGDENRGPPRAAFSDQSGLNYVEATVYTFSPPALRSRNLNMTCFSQAPVALNTVFRSVGLVSPFSQLGFLGVAPGDGQCPPRANLDVAHGAMRVRRAVKLAGQKKEGRWTRSTAALVESRDFQLGMITVSMTWMTPLLAMTSVFTTLALSTLTPSLVSMLMLSPWTVLAESSFTTSAAATLPGTT